MTLVPLEEITGNFMRLQRKIAIQPEKNFDDILKEENTEYIWSREYHYYASSKICAIIV